MSSLADGEVGEHALAGLGDGDPRPVLDAADAAALHHEGVAPVGEALAALLAGSTPPSTG